MHDLKYTSFLLTLLLSSCVTTEKVTQYTDSELCMLLDPIRYVATPSEKKIVRAEIIKRELNCMSIKVIKNSETESTINELKELKDLFEKGLITEELYKEEQKRILQEK